MAFRRFLLDIVQVGTAKSPFPGPVFVQTEDGLSEIDSNKFPLAKSFNKVDAALLTEWCDAVLFATWKIRTQTEDAADGNVAIVLHRADHQPWLVTRRPTNRPLRFHKTVRASD